MAAPDFTAGTALSHLDAAIKEHFASNEVTFQALYSNSIFALIHSRGQSMKDLYNDTLRRIVIPVQFNDPTGVGFSDSEGNIPVGSVDPGDVKFQIQVPRTWMSKTFDFGLVHATQKYLIVQEVLNGIEIGMRGFQDSIGQAFLYDTYSTVAKITGAATTVSSGVYDIPVDNTAPFVPGRDFQVCLVSGGTITAVAVVRVVGTSTQSRAGNLRVSSTTNLTTAALTSSHTIHMTNTDAAGATHKGLLGAVDNTDTFPTSAESGVNRALPQYSAWRSQVIDKTDEDYADRSIENVINILFDDLRFNGSRVMKMDTRKNLMRQLLSQMCIMPTDVYGQFMQDVAEDRRLGAAYIRELGTDVETYRGVMLLTEPRLMSDVLALSLKDWYHFVMPFRFKEGHVNVGPYGKILHPVDGKVWYRAEGALATQIFPRMLRTQGRIKNITGTGYRPAA